VDRGIDYTRIIKVPEHGLQIPGGDEELISRDHALINRINRVLIPEICIKKRVEALARQIADDHIGKRQILLVPVLKGAFVFAADLGRQIINCRGPEVKIDFYHAETYGSEIKAEGEAGRLVKIIRRPRFHENTDLLLIDDVADTVRTLTAILNDAIEIIGFEPSRIKICFLLNKILKNPSIEIEKLKNDLKPDYVGFEVPDLWIAGYGIDAGEDFRLLPYIVSVNEEYYR
jgi:hypoxanthine phosphoribosyltransferase